MHFSIFHFLLLGSNYLPLPSNTIEMDINEVEGVVTLWISLVKQAGVVDSGVE